MNPENNTPNMPQNLFPSPDVPQQFDVPPVTPPKSKKKLLVIIAAVVLVLIVCLLVGAMLSKPKPKQVVSPKASSEVAQEYITDLANAKYTEAYNLYSSELQQKQASFVKVTGPSIYLTVKLADCKLEKLVATDQEATDTIVATCPNTAGTLTKMTLYFAVEDNTNKIIQTDWVNTK